MRAMVGLTLAAICASTCGRVATPVNTCTDQGCSVARNGSQWFTLEFALLCGAHSACHRRMHGYDSYRRTRGSYLMSADAVQIQCICRGGKAVSASVSLHSCSSWLFMFLVSSPPFSGQRSTSAFGIINFTAAAPVQALVQPSHLDALLDCYQQLQMTRAPNQVRICVDYMNVPSPCPGTPAADSARRWSPRSATCVRSCHAGFTHQSGVPRQGTMGRPGTCQRQPERLAA